MNKVKSDLHEKVMNREMAARADAVSEENRTVELSFSSEEPYMRWGENEILSHEPGAVDLGRLETIGVLLWNHDSDEPIGAIQKVWIGDDRRGHALVRFDTDPKAEGIFEKVKSGTLKGVSVGYRYLEYSELAENETSFNGRWKGPAIVATRWEPLEISIVSVPADATVGVGRAADLTFKEGDKTMEDKAIMKPEPAKKVDEAAIRREAMEAERQRVEAITGLCRKFDIAPDDFIRAGDTVESVQAKVLEQLEKQRKPVEMTVVKDDGEKFRAAAADGLALRAGLAVEHPAEGADQMRNISMMRLAEEFYRRQTGKDPLFVGRDMMLRTVFSGGTGAFQAILANVGHKSMLKAYNEIPTTYQYWTVKGSNSDFKPTTRVGLGAADELLEMTENGEFKSSEMSDYSVATSIKTYGRSYAITQKAIINDDLGALTDIPARYGAAVRRQINRMAYDVLVGAGIFSAANKNQGTGALSIDTLAKAKAAMAKQRDPSNKTYINAQPAYLIVPTELEVAAAQLIASAVDPTKANNTPNPFANRLTVVSDPNLEDASAWYLAAAPGVVPGIEVTFLDGKDTPTMESQVDFNTLGVKTRVYINFGINVLDFRAFYKSTGK